MLPTAFLVDLMADPACQTCLVRALVEQVFELKHFQRN
jgi:hypothetical protein